MAPRMVDPKNLPASMTNKVPEKVQEKLPDNYWEIKDLPSRNTFYPKDVLIQGRKMNVLEVKKIATMDETNSTEIVNDVLSRCISGIRLDDIVVPDKLYLIFWLRYNTYQDKGYKVGYTCQHCEKEVEYSFDLNQLDVNSFKDEYLSKMDIDLPSGKKCKLKYQTIGKEKELEIFAKKYVSDKLFEYNEDIANLSICVSVDGIGTDIKSVYDWLVGLDASDYTIIENTMDSIAFGVSPFIKAKCKECKEDSTIGVSFRSDFFLPKYTKE